MLKGERYKVLDAFQWHCERTSWEAFRYHNLDSAKVVSGMPIALSEKLAMECREPEWLKFAIFVQVFFKLVKSLKSK